MANEEKERQWASIDLEDAALAYGDNEPDSEEWLHAAANAYCDASKALEAAEEAEAAAAEAAKAAAPVVTENKLDAA